VKILRAYRVKLDPTVEQRKQLARQTGAARWSYNWALTEWRAQHERVTTERAAWCTRLEAVSDPTSHAFGEAILKWKSSREMPSWMALHKQLTQVKKAPATVWLKEVSAYVVREALHDLGDAYKHFFRKLKQHNRGDHHECRPARTGRCQLGEPQYRGRDEPSGRGFRVAQPQAVKLSAVGAKGLSDRLSVAGVGDIRISWDHRGKIPLGANYRGLAVRQVAGDWYAAVQVEEEREENFPQLARAGVEVGVRVLTVTTDSGMIGIPIRELPHLTQEKRKLALWSRRMARRHVRGKKSREQSRGWHECVRRVQQTHVRIADMRKDAIHQATTRIVRKADAGVLVLRDSQVHRMLGRAGKEGAELRKRNALAPGVAQAAMFEVRRQIEYKQRWNGGETVIAPSDYPSTRRCSNCGSVRETDPGYPGFSCASCGARIDRESNSAENLRQYDPEDFVPKNISGRGRRGDSPLEGSSDAVECPVEPDHSTAGASTASTASPDSGEGASSITTLGAGNRAVVGQLSAETDVAQAAIQPEAGHPRHAIRTLSTSAEVVNRTRSNGIVGLRAVSSGADGAARKPGRNRVKTLRDSRERWRS
jgi:putative transposase